MALAIVLLGSGCFSTTQVVRSGSAGPDEMGFGSAVHTHVAYMVFAAVVSSYVGTGIASASPTDGDAWWQVDGGGDELRYCRRQADGGVCQRVAVPSRMWADSFFIVDPTNLGRFAAATQSSGPGGAFVALSGQYVSPPAPRRLPADQGIWLVPALRDQLVHCAVADVGPACEVVTLDGKRIEPRSVLGLFVLGEGEARADVIWLQSGPRGEDLLRCEARPAERGATPDRGGPRCAPARREAPTRLARADAGAAAQAPSPTRGTR